MFKINLIKVNQNEVILSGSGIQLATDRKGVLLLLGLLLREYKNGNLYTNDKDAEIYVNSINDSITCIQPKPGIEEPASF